ncbi:MAG: superinfection immunity protein [Alteraurantiacibacter sp.]
MTQTQIIVIAVTGIVMLLFCLLPVIIAYARGHHDKRLIAKLSPLAILSFALWFALIVWAVTDKRNDSVVSRWIEKVKDRNLLPWIVGALVLLGIVATAASFLIQ